MKRSWLTAEGNGDESRQLVDRDDGPSFQRVVVRQPRRTYRGTDATIKGQLARGSTAPRVSPLPGHDHPPWPLTPAVPSVGSTPEIPTLPIDVNAADGADASAYVTNYRPAPGRAALEGVGRVDHEKVPAVMQRSTTPQAFHRLAQQDQGQEDRQDRRQLVDGGPRRIRHALRAAVRHRPRWPGRLGMKTGATAVDGAEDDADRLKQPCPTLLPQTTTVRGAVIMELVVATPAFREDRVSREQGRQAGGSDHMRLVGRF